MHKYATCHYTFVPIILCFPHQVKIVYCDNYNNQWQNEAKQEMVEVNGVTYEIDYLKEKLSIITGIEQERLYFVVEKMAFYDTEYDYEFKLSEYIESINAV